MATTTTNFGWDIPQSTDLVKDGATAIAALGQDIDTALVDLKGGTTGQVLSKASGTDLDFTWVAQDDSNAIQNAIVDAKGDLIAATAADTPARLAVGTNGQVLTADSTAATGLAWANATSGSMTVLASGSLSSGTLTLSGISGSYKDLRLVIRDFYPSTPTQANCRLNNDSGSNYSFNGTYWFVTGSIKGALGQQNTFIDLTNTGINATDNNNSVQIDLYDYANATSRKIGNTIYSGLSTSDGQSIVTQSFTYYPVTAITRIDFYLSSGNFSGGTYVLYGVN
jgi:hypothetical protein